MSQQIRGQGGHLCFLISLKHVKFVEDVEFLHTVKFHQIQLSGFRGEVENVTVNHRPGAPGHPGFLISPKNTNLVEDVEFLLPVKLKMYRRQTMHLSLQLRCTKTLSKLSCFGCEIQNGAPFRTFSKAKSKIVTCAYHVMVDKICDIASIVWVNSIYV